MKVFAIFVKIIAVFTNEALWNKHAEAKSLGLLMLLAVAASFPTVSSSPYQSTFIHLYQMKVDE